MDQTVSVQTETKTRLELSQLLYKASRTEDYLKLSSFFPEIIQDDHLLEDLLDRVILDSSIILNIQVVYGKSKDYFELLREIPMHHEVRKRLEQVIENFPSPQIP